MTIQQHASFDSSAAELNATSKLVKAWESKNAKNAAKAGGISLMALSLAACGGSSTTTTTPVVETPVDETPVVETPVVGTSQALTKNTDIVTGLTEGDDTISATSVTLTAGDVIVDTTTTDNDTLTVVITNADNADAPAAVSGIENVVYDIQSFSTPTIDLTGVNGAAISANTSQVLGATSVTVTGLAATNSFTSGAALTGTLNVTLAEGSNSVVTSAAGTIAIEDAGEEGASLVSSKAGTTAAPVTINVEGDGDDDGAVSATANDALSISAVGAVSLNTNAGVSGTDQVENLTLSGNGAAATYTIGASDAVEKITLIGDQDVTVSAGAADLETETVTDATTAGTTTVSLTGTGLGQAATNGFTKIGADVLELAGTAHTSSAAIDIADGSTVRVATDQTNALAIASSVSDVASADGAADETVTLNVVIDQSAALTVTDFEVINVNVEAKSATDTDTARAMTVDGAYTAESGNVAATGSEMTLTGALDIGSSSFTALVVDASGYTGNITHTVDADKTLTFKSGAGDDVITAETAKTQTIDGGAGTDKLVLVADMSKVTFSSFEVMNAAVTSSAATYDFKASQLDGYNAVVAQTGTVSGTSNTAVIEINAASSIDSASIDLSGLSFDNTTLVSVVVDGTKTASTMLATDALTITGTMANDTITGNQGADTITAGEGDDVIVGGIGADIIDLTEATAAKDTVTVFGKDVVSGFGAGSGATGDDIILDIKQAGATSSHIDEAGDYLVSLTVTGTSSVAGTTSNIDVVATAVASGGAYDGTVAAGDFAVDFAAVFSTDGTAADLVAKIVNGDTGGAVFTASSNNDWEGFFITGTTGGDTQIWHHDDTVGATANKLDASDLTLVATLSDVADLDVANLIIA